MYSILEKVKIVEFYEATNSVVATQQKFCHHYNVRRSPSSKTIESTVVKFKTKGPVLNQQKVASWRPKECHTVENIKTVRLSVIEDPKKSYRKRAQALRVKPISLLTTLRKKCKINFVQMPYGSAAQ